jgi:hypothetical protein
MNEITYNYQQAKQFTDQAKISIYREATTKNKEKRSEKQKESAQQKFQTLV